MQACVSYCSAPHSAEQTAQVAIGTERTILLPNSAVYKVPDEDTTIPHGLAMSTDSPYLVLGMRSQGVTSAGQGEQHLVPVHKTGTVAAHYIPNVSVTWSELSDPALI